MPITETTARPTGLCRLGLCCGLWPQGIHVAHPVIDMVVDTEFIRSDFYGRYALEPQRGILNPSPSADRHWQMHCKPREAW